MRNVKVVKCITNQRHNKIKYWNLMNYLQLTEACNILNISFVTLTVLIDIWHFSIWNRLLTGLCTLLQSGINLSSREYNHSYTGYIFLYNSLLHLTAYPTDHTLFSWYIYGVLHLSRVPSTAEFLFLLWAVYLCYAVRTVPSAFHEPRYTAIAVHNELVLSAIFYVIR